MTNYIKSEGVKVFPSSLREGAYSSGKFTSEYNLTSFLRAVTDSKSFVIADPNIEADNPHYDANYYRFIINGFYFEVERNYIDNLKSNAESVLYASIRLDKDGRLISWKGGTNLDDEGNFIALNFDTVMPESTPEFTCYSLDLKSEDRYAKFNTDTFMVYDSGIIKGNLTDVLNNKQDNITEDNKLEAGLITGVLAEENGGTGSSDLKQVTVGNSRHMVDDSDNALKVGSATEPVYFNSGVPYKVELVNEANKLSSNKNTPISAGDQTIPVYFKDGQPVSVGSGSKLSVRSMGLNEDKGELTSTADTVIYKSVYFAGGGNPTEGPTITISKNSPQGSGKPGDIWFKYKD